MCELSRPIEGLRVAKIQDGFFRVHLDNLDRLFEAGADEVMLCAYLVMACGTHKGGATSTWSVEAVRKYAGCRPTRAKEAVDCLIEIGMVKLNDERSKKGRPVYTLIDWGATTPERELWLPNTLVVGVVDAAPYPLALLREGKDPQRIRLLLDLYSHQRLIEEGGVSADLLSAPVAMEKIGEKNGSNVWQIGDGSYNVSDALTAGHGASFWERFGTLRALGFIEETFLIEDAEGGEPLFIRGTSNEEMAQYRLLQNHAKNLLGRDSIGFALPIPQHIKDPFARVIVRIKHRPKTKRTAAWWGQLQEINRAYLNRYGLLKEEKTIAPMFGGISFT